MPSTGLHFCGIVGCRVGTRRITAGQLPPVRLIAVVGVPRRARDGQQALRGSASLRVLRGGANARRRAGTCETGTTGCARSRGRSGTRRGSSSLVKRRLPPPRPRGRVSCRSGWKATSSGKVVGWSHGGKRERERPACARGVRVKGAHGRQSARRRASSPRRPRMRAGPRPHLAQASLGLGVDARVHARRGVVAQGVAALLERDGEILVGRASCGEDGFARPDDAGQPNLHPGFVR